MINRNIMHYTCKECKGVSDEPGVCQTEECSSKGHDLVECDCEDGLHGESSEEEIPSEE